MFKDKAEAEHSKLEVVSENHILYSYNEAIIRENCNLALTLSEKWLDIHNVRVDPQKTQSVVKSFKYEGRSQILEKDGIRFYLDGAHTILSIQHCVKWFRKGLSSKKDVGY